VIEPRSLIYLIDPLNPLGSRYQRAELEAIVALARETQSLIVHDCTYRHFATGHSLVAELYPEGTFTTYSFSKWLGLAGMRLGAVIAEPQLLSSLTAVPANPLGAGIVGQRAAIAGLKVRRPWLEQVRRVNRANIERVEQVVAQTGFGEVVVSPSHGNFLAVDVTATGLHSETVCDALLAADVFIRPGTYQSPHFGERFVKVSTSVPPEWVERFAAAWTSLAERTGVTA
jgi:aspartate/methionine/tyrosine aminotransferase